MGLLLRTHVCGVVRIQVCTCSSISFTSSTCIAHPMCCVNILETRFSLFFCCALPPKNLFGTEVSKYVVYCSTGIHDSTATAMHEFGCGLSTHGQHQRLFSNLGITFTVFVVVVQAINSLSAQTSPLPPLHITSSSSSFQTLLARPSTTRPPFLSNAG